MTWRNFQLGTWISKVTETTTLWRTEIGIIEISENALAIPIELDDQRKGHVFHGQGKLLLDAIAETDKGAVGKSIEKELNEPFLMLGKAEEIGQHLTKASEEDFIKMDYENQQGFIDKAEDLCERFFKGKVDSHEGFHRNHGLIFAFQNEANRLDILLAKGSKLVYKATDIVFVSNENKLVLKSPGEVICSNYGKSVIIGREPKSMREYRSDMRSSRLGYGSHSFLNEYISEHECKKIMEIGVADGGNARTMVMVAIRNFSPKEVEYYGFDLFGGDDDSRMKQVMQKLKDTGCKFKLFKGDSAETLPKKVENLPKMDLIFIDGGHSYATVKSDWENSRFLMHDETAVFFHNYDSSGPKGVVDSISREEYQVKIIHSSSDYDTAFVKKKD